MESALTPREIQTRLRDGDSVAEVAEAAGVDISYIETYAGPVLAEREHAAHLARGAQVRRRGEASAHRKLENTAMQALEAKSVDTETVTWDAWRAEDRHWTVKVTWTEDDDQHEALFDYDPRGKYSLPANEVARRLIGDVRTPIVRKPDPDDEPTIDLHDEMAIVRVVQEQIKAPAVVPDKPLGKIVNIAQEEADAATEDPAASDPADDDYDEPSDYVDPEFEQVDGIYDFVPNQRNDLDVLYDMLAGFNEDSVRIYRGLMNPPVEPAGEELPACQPQAEALQEEEIEEEVPEAELEAVAHEPVVSEPEQVELFEEEFAEIDFVEIETPEPVADESTAMAGEAEDAENLAEPEQDVSPAEEPAEEAVPPAVASEAAQDQLSEDPLAQDPLVEVAEADDSPKPKPRPKKNSKRATVPSWDEIMFGAPRAPRKKP